MGARQHQSRSRGVLQRPATGRSVELLRPARARLRGHEDRHRHGRRSITTSRRRSTLRNLTRYGKTSRDSVITAPRFVSVNTSTDINRQLQSRDMVDDIVANQTNADGAVRRRRTGHALVTGVEVAASVGELSCGPARPRRSPICSIRIRTTRTPVRSRAPARATSGLRARRRSMPSTPPTLGSRLELSGGLRWDRFDVDYESRAATGAITAFERTDDMVSWRAGAVYKPRAERQRLLRLRHVVQSVGGRARR